MTATIARRRLLGAMAAAPVVAAIPAIALAANPTGDAAVIAAFQRWLTAHNDMIAVPGPVNITDEESYWRYLDAVYEVMELPATGAVGMALKSYVVLDEELCSECGRPGRHSASLVFPIEQMDGELPTRIAAGLFESVCNIVPHPRQFAVANKGDVLMLDAARLSGSAVI